MHNISQGIGYIIIDSDILALQNSYDFLIFFVGSFSLQLIKNVHRNSFLPAYLLFVIYKNYQMQDY